MWLGRLAHEITGETPVPRKHPYFQSGQSTSPPLTFNLELKCLHSPCTLFVCCRSLIRFQIHHPGRGRSKTDLSSIPWDKKWAYLVLTTQQHVYFDRAFPNTSDLGWGKHPYAKTAECQTLDRVEERTVLTGGENSIKTRLSN